ncbi:MAG: aspartate kinase [Halanaerobiaceae bacterium]
MEKIVQKFGGTTLNEEEKRIQVAKCIKEKKQNHKFPVVVVSAMGRKGDPYATDTLIQLARKKNDDIAPREKDLIMSCGEIISSVIIVQELKNINLKARALTGGQAGIITDGNFTKASIEEINPQKIMDYIKSDIIPVIAGFQGKTNEGEITTLGRGGSDTTASVVATGVNAEVIEIYTDVKGVMTADPVKVEDAKVLSEINYNEVCELAYQGARVLHPRAVEIARNNNIPIKIKSIFNSSKGTIIRNNKKGIKGDQLVTGVTSRDNIIFIKIIPDKKTKYATGLKIFNLLAANDISVDFINIRPSAISFIIEKDVLNKFKEIMEKEDFNYSLSSNFVKVSAVGGGMTGQPGVMSKIVETLNENNIAIYQTTDSHTTISCLIKKEKENEALNLLHKAFSLEKA